jgi:ABC-type Zn uptake system ZnuABC Zn-binding protein ZnuA
LGSNTDEYATGSDTSFAVNADYPYNTSTVTGETYAWYPIVTEAGTYRVQVHYLAGPDRAVHGQPPAPRDAV